MAIHDEKLCLGCGTCSACVPMKPEEHRGSRPHMDSDFREAAASGFAPLSDSEKEAFREKLVEMGAVIHGGRR
jgi:coenzyme F420-reducing hydrogenase gamma subunit